MFDLISKYSIDLMYVAIIWGVFKCYDVFGDSVYELNINEMNIHDRREDHVPPKIVLEWNISHIFSSIASIYKRRADGNEQPDQTRSSLMRNVKILSTFLVC